MHEKMVRHSTVSARSAHAAIQRARLSILTTAVPLVAMQVDDLSIISLSSTFSFFLFKAKKRISVITSSGIVFYCLKKDCFFCFSFILDIKFVGRTSRGRTGGRSNMIFHPLSLCGAVRCGACLNFSREEDSAIPFPRQTSGILITI